MAINAQMRKKLLDVVITFNCYHQEIIFVSIIQNTKNIHKYI